MSQIDAYSPEWDKKDYTVLSTVEWFPNSERPLDGQFGTETFGFANKAPFPQKEFERHVVIGDNAAHAAVTSALKDPKLLGAFNMTRSDKSEVHEKETFRKLSATVGDHIFDSLSENCSYALTDPHTIKRFTRSKFPSEWNVKEGVILVTVENVGDAGGPWKCRVTIAPIPTGDTIWHDMDKMGARFCSELKNYISKQIGSRLIDTLKFINNAEQGRAIINSKVWQFTNDCAEVLKDYTRRGNDYHVAISNPVTRDQFSFRRSWYSGMRPETRYTFELGKDGIPVEVI